MDDSETKCKEGESQKILDYLSTMETGIIVFTKEDQEGDIPPVLDLKQKEDRKTKRIGCTVHCKKTHTNINMKQRSNHPDIEERAPCDEKHLAEELHNSEDVFVANGYSKETVRRFMEQRPQQVESQEQEEQESRRVVTIPYLRGLSEQFRRIANQHSFRFTLNPGGKVKEVKHTYQEPLGERQKGAVYNIPCDCQSAVYVVET